MPEIWKDIPGYEGLYQVSNIGRVRGLQSRWGSRSAPRIMSLYYTNGGYLRVSITKNNNHISYLVHRLVAMAFLPNPLSLPCVDHINGDRDDNRVENLRWCSQKENCNYYLAKKHFCERRNKVSIVCVETGKQYNSSLEVMKETKLDGSAVIKCCKGHRKTCGGYHWKYVN